MKTRSPQLRAFAGDGTIHSLPNPFAPQQGPFAIPGSYGGLHRYSIMQFICIARSARSLPPVPVREREILPVDAFSLVDIGMQVYLGRLDGGVPQVLLHDTEVL